MKKLMVLGAGSGQLDIIQKAQRRGICVKCIRYGGGFGLRSIKQLSAGSFQRKYHRSIALGTEALRSQLQQLGIR